MVTGRRGYDAQNQLFPPRELWRGIEIYRISSTALGKGAKWRRAIDFASFTLQCTARILTLPSQDAVITLTSPPLISALGALLTVLRRSRLFYWVMDLNPDEAVAAGWLNPGSMAARGLEWISRFSMRRAERIIVLDRFVKERVVGKGIPDRKVVVVPTWSLDDAVRFDPAGRAAFRKEHGLTDKFVVMYSGNHSPCHPLDTLLAAARTLDGAQRAKDEGRRAEGPERRMSNSEPRTPNSQLPTPNFHLLRNSFASYCRPTVRSSEFLP